MINNTYLRSTSFPMALLSSVTTADSNNGDTGLILSVRTIFSNIGIFSTSIFTLQSCILEKNTYTFSRNVLLFLFVTSDELSQSQNNMCVVLQLVS